MSTLSLTIMTILKSIEAQRHDTYILKKVLASITDEHSEFKNGCLFIT